MLAEIESLLIGSIKQFIQKPELLVPELQSLYEIYKDLKVITNGDINNESKKENTKV